MLGNEQNGPGVPASFPFVLDAGTDTFTIPADQVITSAVFTSTFGNSTVHNTAIMSVFVNGVDVGDCASMSDPCWTAQTPTPFTYTYTNADLATLSSGSADLYIQQNDNFVIRLGASTLTVTTNTVPEPTAAIPVGAGLLLLGFLARRKHAIAVD